MKYTPKTLAQHLDPDLQPKRILALDGGGVRGILTLSYLEHIENLLRVRHGNDPDFRLCHYFDLIAGTSTGSIIASALAVGLEVKTVQNKYRQLAKNVFKSSLFRRGLFRSKFSKKELEKALQDEAVLGEETTLGSSSLETGLMVMAKRIDTGSPWPLANNFRGKYFRRREGSSSIPNEDYKLWQVVRASTAAPYFFKPETLRVATRVVDGKTHVVKGSFVDGGVSTANNPALQAFQMATLEGYRFGWETGADKILLISVGTGLANPEHETHWFFAGNAINALLSVMDDCNALVETMLQWLSTSDTARKIDGEIGDLKNDLLAEKPLLTYQRYNVEFSKIWLERHLQEIYTEKTLKSLEKMDNPKNLSALERLGSVAAKKQIKETHFPNVFDLNKGTTP